MIRVIWSEDELLATEAADEMCAGTDPGAEILHLDAEGGLEDLEEALFAGSLFAEQRVVVIRNAQALPKAGTEQLIAALHREGLPTLVVVEAVSDRVPRQLIDSLADVGGVQRLPRPRRGELVAWVGKRLRSAGLNSDREAPAALVEAIGEGLRDLASAVEQLALRSGPGSRVERADVLDHFSPSGDQPIWVLFDAIVQHDGPKAFGTLGRLLAHGDEPLPVLGAIVSQIRGVIRAKSLLERGPAHEADLARSLGVSAGRAAVLRRQSARLTWDWLLGVHRLCAEADFELKGGEDGAVLPADAVLERLVAGALNAG